MDLMQENQNDMLNKFIRHKHMRTAQGSYCRTKKETLFPDIFESGKLRLLLFKIYLPLNIMRTYFKEVKISVF